MTIEQQVKRDAEALGLNLNLRELWEAVCAAICEDGDRRRKERE